MGYIFIKLIEGDLVSTSGGLGFRKLITFGTSPPSTDSNTVDLSSLGLPSGTYAITVVALATGLKKSRMSNTVIYKVE